MSSIHKILILSAIPVIALAQSGSSTISGSIKDPTGAAISSAKKEILFEVIRFVDFSGFASQVASGNTSS